MFVMLKSSNPEFSFLLSKNPSSGLFIKNLRKGFVVGQFTSDDEYVAAFVDSSRDPSFEDEEHDSLPSKAFLDPEAALNVLITCFSSIGQDKYKEDYEKAPYESSLVIPCVDVNKIASCVVLEEGVNITLTPIENSTLYSVKIEGSSMVDVLRYGCILTYLAMYSRSEYNPIEQAMVYLKMLNKVDASFLIRHKYRALFECSQIKKIINYLNNDDVKLSVFGNMDSQRKAFVNNLIINRTNVIDIGCGKGAYIKVVKPDNYIGVDIDEGALAFAERRANENDSLKNSSFFASYIEALDSLTEPTTAILIEVIEHIDKEEVVETLIPMLMEHRYITEILISTPNRSFNKFFGIADGVTRVEDHLYELDEEEFAGWFGSANIVTWGDSYKGMQPTQYAHIVKGK